MMYEKKINGNDQSHDNSKHTLDRYIFKNTKIKSLSKNILGFSTHPERRIQIRIATGESDIFLYASCPIMALNDEILYIQWEIMDDDEEFGRTKTSV